MSVLVTGINGFIGDALAALLVARDVSVVGIGGPTAGASWPGKEKLSRYHVIDLTQEKNFPRLLDGIDTVIHLAGRTKLHPAEVLEFYRPINVDVTVRLAKAAASAKVKRFIFMSTIGVNGSRTDKQAFVEDAAPKPHSAYSRSKLEAELALADIARTAALPAVVIRPTVVLGPGAKGTIGSFMKLIDSGMPVPFGGIQNRRSFTGLNNLVNFIDLCRLSPAAVGETFLIADEPSLSTPEFLKRCALRMGRPGRMFSIPPRLIRNATHLFGSPARFNGLWDSLEVSTEKARELLGWTQLYSIDEAIASAIDDYLVRRGRGSGFGPSASS